MRLPPIKTGMVQLRVTVAAIPEVAIDWSSTFSRFRYRLDAGFRRRETIEYLKPQKIDFSGRIAHFAAILRKGTLVEIWPRSVVPESGAPFRSQR